MAMTKKEQLAVQELVDRLETISALRWTEPTSPDVPPPSGCIKYSEGWDYNAHSMRVWIGWSTSVSHGTGRPPIGERYSNGYRGERHMFSSEELALKAMRHAVEKRAAKELMLIDKMIAKAKATP